MWSRSLLDFEICRSKKSAFSSALSLHDFNDSKLVGLKTQLAELENMLGLRQNHDELTQS
jgi:hypothetical protein